MQTELNTYENIFLQIKIFEQNGIQPFREKVRFLLQTFNKYDH